MQLPPLTEGQILNRYQRFLADIRLPDGQVVTAHCPNTGTMATCWRPGARAAISHSDKPARKLPWTLERIDMGGGWIGVHTGRTNAVVAEGIQQGLIQTLRHDTKLRREVPVEFAAHRARVDILLSHEGAPDTYVEVKNVTLLDSACVRFPDAVTVRGLKHLEVLAELVRRGCRGVILFAVNRPEGDYFAPAWSIDRNYSKRLLEVSKLGVEVVAVRIHHCGGEMIVSGVLPVHLEPPP